LKAHIVTLPGDGIGPEVTAEAVRVLHAVGKSKGHSFSFAEHLLGGCSIEKHGVALTDETLAACKSSNAVLLGAVGGPKWDNPTATVRPEQGLLAIRKGDRKSVV
jgi:3-isopropylmalate dehydrogenase